MSAERRGILSTYTNRSSERWQHVHAVRQSVYVNSKRRNTTFCHMGGGGNFEHHAIYHFVIYHLPFIDSFNHFFIHFVHTICFAVWVIFAFSHFRIFAFSGAKVHVAFDNRCARVYTAPLNKRATDASALPKD